MNDKQNAKQNMHHAVLLVLNENNDIYSTVPAIIDAVSELDEVVKQIGIAAQQQSRTTLQSATKEKSDAETNLVTESVKTANALYALAITENNLTLLPKVTITKSMMYQAQNNEMINIANRIAAEAREYAERLQYYGIDNADIEALEAAIARYKNLVAKPRAVISETKQTTANLVHLFARADTILNDRIDRLMSRFKASAPEFYAVYFNARNIINSSGRKRKQEQAGEEE